MRTDNVTLTTREVVALGGILIALGKLIDKDAGVYRELIDAGLEDPERVIKQLRTALLM